MTCVKPGFHICLHRIININIKAIYTRKTVTRRPATHTRNSLRQKERSGSGGEKERTLNFITEGL